jgi:hypothetical protein
LSHSGDGPDIGIAHYDSDEDHDDDMVAAWSVDRLGRSLIDLLHFLRELQAKGTDLFLHQQGLDSSTAVRPGHVSNAGRVRRIRTIDDPRAGHGRLEPGPQG